MQHNVEQVHRRDIHVARISSIYYLAIAIVPGTCDILMRFILVGAFASALLFVVDHRDHLRPSQCILAEAVSKATIVPHMASLYDFHTKLSVLVRSNLSNGIRNNGLHSCR